MLLLFNPLQGNGNTVPFVFERGCLCLHTKYETLQNKKDPFQAIRWIIKASAEKTMIRMLPECFSFLLVKFLRFACVIAG